MTTTNIESELKRTEFNVEASEEFKGESIIGIDLGTTYTCVGLWRKTTSTVEVLNNDMGKNITPSWVSYGDSGTEISVGEKAKHQKNKMYDVKRIIGKKWDDDVDDIKSRLYYTLIKGQNDEVLIEPFGGSSSIV